MWIRKFKSLYTFYFILHAIILCVVFHLQYEDCRILYTHDYLRWNKVQLDSYTLQKIESDIKEGFVIIHHKEKAYVHDPHLLLQKRIILDGRMFNRYDLKENQDKLRIIAIDESRVIPRDSDNNEVLAYFEPFKLDEVEIQEIQPIKHYHLMDVGPIYYFIENEADKEKMIDILGQDYHTFTKDDVQLTTELHTISSLFQTIMIFFSTLFNLLFLLSLVTYCKTFEEELKSFLYFSKSNPLKGIIIYIIKKCAWNFLFVNIIYFSTLYFIMNIHYALLGLFVTNLTFFISLYLTFYFQVRRWKQNV